MEEIKSIVGISFPSFGTFFCFESERKCMKRLVFFLTTIVLSIVGFAQDVPEKVDVNINSDGGGWYTSPLVWVIGAAVFILLLVALLRGGGRRAD